MGLPAEARVQLRQAAELHDIGKLGIPEEILDKPGPLDAEEWTFVRRHPLIGERIIGAAPALASAAKLVRSTHERPDGTGSPDGLSGDQIPLGRGSSRSSTPSPSWSSSWCGRPSRHRPSPATRAAPEPPRRC
jgi:two-component system cell cycle response regulator